MAALAPIPYCFVRHVALWRDLHARRQSGMGLATFSWVDLQAYCQITGEVLSRMDLLILDIIEAEFFTSYADGQEKRANRKAKPEKGRR